MLLFIYTDYEIYENMKITKTFYEIETDDYLKLKL